MPSLPSKAEGDCTKGCKKYFAESPIRFNPKKSMYLKLLKEKEKEKAKQLKKIRTKIQLEEFKQKQEQSEIVLNMSQINEARSVTRSTRNLGAVHPQLRMKTKETDDKSHPLYTSILGSRKISMSINKANNKNVSDTIKKIRLRVKSLIKSKKAGFKDRRMKSVVDT